MRPLRRRFRVHRADAKRRRATWCKVGTLALDDFLEELNRRIAKTEGREKQIGHSFLLEGDEPIDDPDEFARRFRQEILPLLQSTCLRRLQRSGVVHRRQAGRQEAQTLEYEQSN
jgi:5-methylcytosine-specific restriction protein B